MRVGPKCISRELYRELTHIWQLANTRFGDTYGYEFKSLRCPECNGSLDNMDKSKDTVKCRYCGELFEIRAFF